MKVVLASALLCCSLTAYAENEMNTDNMPADNLESDVGKFNIVLTAALTFGGDELAVTTTDRTVTAGGLLYLAAGGVYHASSAMDIQATLGVHVDAVEATNGTVEFTRSFFEVMPFYVAESGNRFGVGLAHVMSTEMTSPLGTIPFDDTNGIVVEYEWMLAKHYFLGVRFADITYTSTNGAILLPNGSVTDTVDGSYFGVLMEAHF